MYVNDCHGLNLVCLEKNSLKYLAETAVQIGLNLSKKPKCCSNVSKLVQIIQNWSKLVPNLSKLVLLWFVGELGDGAFGKVHKARHRNDRDVYAAAKICNLESDEELEDFTIEIDILSEVSHENVIQLFEAFFHEDKLWVSATA